MTGNVPVFKKSEIFRFRFVVRALVLASMQSISSEFINLIENCYFFRGSNPLPASTVIRLKSNGGLLKWLTRAVGIIVR